LLLAEDLSLFKQKGGSDSMKKFLMGGLLLMLLVLSGSSNRAIAHAADGSCKAPVIVSN
jgi:hypothetical protein